MSQSNGGELVSLAVHGIFRSLGSNSKFKGINNLPIPLLTKSNFGFHRDSRWNSIACMILRLHDSVLFRLPYALRSAFLGNIIL